MKQRIEERGSFSSYITIVSEESSKILYSTREFEKFKKYLKDNPPSKEKIKEYLQRKDKAELEGYFKKASGFVLAKALFSHIRRKLQILNYFQTEKLVFDYNKSIKNIGFLKDEREELKKLYETYKKRGKLSQKQVGDYYNLAKQLTNRILKEI